MKKVATPTIAPKRMERVGKYMKCELAPITTAPVTVALCMMSMEILYLYRDVKIDMERQLPVIAKMVFTIMSLLSKELEG